MKTPPWKRTGLASAGLLFLTVLTAPAILPPAHEDLPNFDRRAKVATVNLKEERRAAIATLKASAPEVTVDVSGPPHARWIRAERGFLTGPGGQGRGKSAATLAALPTNVTHRPTKAFMREHAALFGFGPEVLDRARVKREFTTPHNGLKTVVWEQDLDGIAIFESVFVSHTTQHGELVSLTSQFVPDPAQAADTGVPDRALVQQNPTISAAQAVARAARNIGEDLDDAGVSSITGTTTNAEQKQQFEAVPLAGPAEARLVWLPINEDALRLCWEVALTSRARGELYRFLVDVENGEVLLRHCLTEYISDASYRVFLSDSPSPFSPSCPTPCTTQPPVLAPVLVTLSALDTNASPNGWIDDGVNETRGNNVDAHTDRDSNNSPDLPRPQGAPFRTFDFPINLSLAPSTYTNGAVTDLFYWCNWMHDQLYRLGFTEAAGNFQNNNFGRGGLGNDALQADAQDGGGFNNANMSTPSDGSAPRMQMYIFNGPTPDRDGDFDHEIVLHEYTHGLSNRRVGGGVGLSASQSRGMGEGWSDWYGLALLSEPGDDANGVYAAGGYATYLLSGLTTNYYFGIRRYPYCTDLTKNPLTFRDIDPTQASTHPGIPESPLGGGAAEEVHNQGEVWCVTLWEARANLIGKYGHTVGNQLILQLVTDGMNLSPANPNFLQARDAILQADVVNNGGANLPELWMAFAKRGMGYSATSPSSSTTVGVVEAYDIPDSLIVTPGAGFTGIGPVGGPFSPNSASFTLVNISTNPVNWAAAPTAAWLNLSQNSGTITVGGSNSVNVTVAPAANLLPIGVYDNTVRFTNNTSGVVHSRVFTLRVGQRDYFTELFDGNDNDLDNQTLTFTPDGSSSFYSVCREPALAFPTDPIGGANISLGSHTFTTLSLTSNISIYGRSTNVIYLASEGHLTLLSGDSSGTISLANHFSRPRVSASLAHIHPTENGGTVSWRQLSNRVAITFNRVVEYSSTRTNSFQIELFYNGRIRMTHLQCASLTGLVGLSAGTGIPGDFIESDLSGYGGCALPLIVTGPTNAVEGAGALTGQVNIFSPAATNVTVTLTSSDNTEIIVPATVTILAGATTTNFNVTVGDDGELDGTQLATISATAPGYALASSTVVIADNETAVLNWNVPATMTEGVSPVLASIRSSAAPTANITLNLSSSDTTEVQVPPTVILPAGQTNALFSVTVINDTQIDGAQSVNLTAQVPNWTSGFATVTVNDNEPTNLVVLLPASAREGNGVLFGAGQVRISGTLLTNFVVSLLSTDTTEVTVPSTATILAGQTNTSFNLTIVDDADIDSSQSVAVIASATGFASGSTNMVVTDDESPPEPFNPSPPHLATNVIQTSDLAWQSGAVPGEIITNEVYFGTTPTPGMAELMGTATNTSWALPLLAPQTTYYWQIVARKAGVTPGPVWQFTTRGLDHFVWSVVPSPQYVSQPFTVTVTAKDAFETTVTNYPGPVNLSGAASGGQPSFTNATLVVATDGINGSVRAALTALGQPHDFVQTAALSTLNFSNYSNVILGLNGGQIQYAGMAHLAAAVNAGTKLIIVGGSSLQEYARGLNDFFIRVNTNNYGWTTVAGLPHISVTAPGHLLAAGLPPTYNLLNNNATYYMARVTDGAATTVALNGDGFPCLIGKPVGAGAVVMFVNAPSESYWGNAPDYAVLRTVISNALQWVQAGAIQSLPITPVVSGAFVNGAWTGNVTAFAPTTNLVLRADDGSGHVGLSNPFAVELQNDIAVSVQDSPDPVSLGGNVTYTINVTNVGPAAATGVVVTNLLSPGVSLVSATPSQGSVQVFGNAVVCNLLTLGGNASATVTIVATTVSTGGLTNLTTVTRFEADAYLANNSAVAHTTVQVPAITINDVSVFEGDSGTATAVFTVSVSPAPAAVVTLNFATVSSSAVSPVDFIATNGILSFAVGQTNRSFAVAIVGDPFYETDETYSVNFSAPVNATLADSVALGTIRNNDAIPMLSIGDVILSEGNSGSNTAIFPVTLSAASGVDVTFNYFTSDGNAVSGSDYLARSGFLTIPAGGLSNGVAVAVNGDLTIEPDEVFYLELTSAANATLLQREGYAWIVNDDGLPGEVDHFVWSAVAPTQYVGQPFPVAIAALDAFDNPAVNFTNAASLNGWGSGGGVTTNTILPYVTPNNSGSGSYTLGYSFTPTNELIVTHVRRYFGTKISIWTDAGVLLASQNVSGTAGMWTETALASPVTLTAGTTYRVAAYTGGGNYYWRADGSNSFPNGSIIQGYDGTGDTFPTAIDTGAKWWAVDLRYTVGSASSHPIAPAITGTFTNGLWSGNITALAPATNLVLQASDGNGHSGISAAMVVELWDDIGLTVTDSPDPVAVGAGLTYLIAVTNTGPAVATGVVVTNLLPDGVTLNLVNPSQGTHVTNGPAIVFQLGSINAGSQAVITILVTPTGTGVLSNRTSVSRIGVDNYLENNTATNTTVVIVPALSIADASATEPAGTTTNLLFNVSLSVAGAQTITVNFATANGTAISGSDYAATNGTLNFAPGQTNQIIAVRLFDDAIGEPNETFTVGLSGAVNAVLGKASGVGTIIDNDGPPEFQITALLATNSKVVDHNAQTSDDRGGIAISPSQVFVTGDSATARFAAADLTGGVSLGFVRDSLCTDLRTETVYLLGNGSTPLTSSGGTVTTLIELNPTTGAPSGVTLPLSQSFTMSSGNIGIFSGYGRVVVYNGTSVYDIYIPTGTVTLRGAMTRPNWYASESWSVWGVAEYFGGTLYLTYRSNSGSQIVRARVPDGVVTTVATFSNLSDLASFVVSPSRSRWYFHYEGSGQFGGSSETLGYADAQFSFISSNPPVIVSQPANQLVALDGTAIFNVTATGTAPLLYQWRKGGTNLVDGGRISGAVSNRLTLLNVQTNDIGLYSVAISNLYGFAISSNAALTVNVPLPPALPCCPAPTNGQTVVSVHALLSWNGSSLGASSGAQALSGTYGVIGTSGYDAEALTHIQGVPGLSPTPVSWTTITTSSGASLFAAYDVIYFSVDASSTDYQNLRTAVTTGNSLEQFVTLGGTLVLNLAGNGGSQSDIGPGGLDYDRSLTHNAASIVNPSHPFITGVGYSGTPLTPVMFDSWSTTDHGNLTALPAGFTELLRNTDGPSMIEYPWGAGRVIASTLTYGWAGSSIRFGPPFSNEVAYAANAVGAQPAQYRVYFGTNSMAQPLIASNLTEASCNPGPLAFDTTYYWQIVASNAVGSVTGAVWQFTTALDEVHFASATASIAENGSLATITVTRENPAGGTLNIQYATTNGTATTGADYTAVSGTLQFSAGVLSTNFQFPILDDSTGEDLETVLLSLSQPATNVLLAAPSNAVLTIVDNDAARVSVFFDPAYVDTNATDGEATNVIAALLAKGCLVQTFTGITSAAFSNAVNGVNILLIPELETGDLGAVLSAAAKGVISNFVAGGGGLIIHGQVDTRDENFINQVFGHSIGAGSTSVTSLLTGAAAGTAFAGGPTNLLQNSGTYEWQRSSLPAGSLSIYQDSGALYTTVAVIPRSAGKIVFLAYDWFNAVPRGTQDGGWDDVLRRALLEATSGVPPVTNQPPSIATQPASQTVSVGNSATFNVVATGSAPLRYQWRKENIAIVGATNASYTLNSVQYSNAGNYSVVVSNAFGFTNSSNAALTVTPPVLVSSQTFNYTGTGQTFTVPPGVVSIQVECWGAQGSDGGGLVGGLGGYACANVAVTSGETVSIYVGELGPMTAAAYGGYSANAFNGGGRGWTWNAAYGYAGSGGGASDVRLGGANLTNRVVVAGGGGGASGNGTCGGGAGGGLIAPTVNCGYGNVFGGSQVAGGIGGQNGSLGQGGMAQSPTTDGWVGGGGGGYYGGGCGFSHGSGAGGSSYTDGYGSYVTSATTNLAGVRAGNGQVIITWQTPVPAPALRFLAPQMINGRLRLLVSTVDSSPIAPTRASNIWVYASTNVTLPLSNWTALAVAPVLTNGLLLLDGINPTNPPARFFRAIEGSWNVRPLRLYAPQVTGNTMTFRAGAGDGLPLTPIRAAKIQFYMSTNLASPFNSWQAVAGPPVLSNGVLHVTGLTLTNSAAFYFRAEETP